MSATCWKCGGLAWGIDEQRRPICEVHDRQRLAAGAGSDALSLWFGLSYANYLTVPRALLEAMPDAWQARFSELLQDLDTTFTWPLGENLRIEVRLRDRQGRFVEDPLAEYRHPDLGAIEDSRRHEPERLGVKP